MKRLPKTHLPNVLVIHAKEDGVASLSSVRWLEKNWQSGQIQVILLDNSYHMITIEHRSARSFWTAYLPSLLLLLLSLTLVVD
jgi:pimeloyl-ACP methyl ester carboxylesterase